MDRERIVDSSMLQGEIPIVKILKENFDDSSQITFKLDSSDLFHKTLKMWSAILRGLVFTSFRY